jgi:phosphofructokinase-like protein
MTSMRLGVLTAGGDCPGLNAVIRAVVRKGIVNHGDEVIGFRDGWAGVVEGRSQPLEIADLRGFLPRGGTMLGTSRANPFLITDGPQRVLETVAEQRIDALVAIGGEGSLGCAHDVGKLGVPVVGVPKTIDNDLHGTEFTFGFHTAVQIATDAIDRLHTTAESHDRVMVVEVMGRHVGWIATYAGLAGGATAILIPEREFDLREVADHIHDRHARGRYASIVVVAEGARPKPGTLDLAPERHDEWGHVVLGGIGNLVAAELERLTSFETRVTILGHVQRGGSPTAYDRVLSTRFGTAAVDAAHDGAFGTMVALRHGDIVRVPLEEVIGRLKTVPPELFDNDVAPFLFA